MGVRREEMGGREEGEEGEGGREGGRRWCDKGGRDGCEKGGGRWWE